MLALPAHQHVAADMKLDASLPSWSQFRFCTWLVTMHSIFPKRCHTKEKGTRVASNDSCAFVVVQFVWSGSKETRTQCSFANDNSIERQFCQPHPWQQTDIWKMPNSLPSLFHYISKWHLKPLIRFVLISLVWLELVIPPPLPNSKCQHDTDTLHLTSNRPLSQLKRQHFITSTRAQSSQMFIHCYFS